MIAPQVLPSGAARPPSSSRAALAAALLRLAAPSHGRLARALTVSLIAHAALALATLPGDTPRPPVSSLSVVLVNTRSEQPPFEPERLAQHDLHGGGEHEQGVAASPLPRQTDAPPSEEALLLALRQEQAMLEAQQLALLTQLRAGQAALAAATATGLAQARDGADTQAVPDDVASQLAELNARIAVLDERVAQYNTRPRQHVIGPSTRAVEHAAYVEAWRLRIEQLGTEHYPPEARGSIYGSLQLTVFIDREGKLLRVEIDRPSPHAVLNLAARRIVQLAAPYPPFPPALAAQLDVLAITRTWHFTRDHLETEAP